MLSNVRPMVSLIRKCALLFIAFSVFGFGLHARLAQYEPSPPNPTAAKISNETRSAQTLKALNKHIELDNCLSALAFAYSLFEIQAPALQPAVEQATIDLSDPRRLDLNGVYSVHGPPTLL